jgi:hypothetical protein
MKDRIKAYHEAGHAVVARALGIAVTYVTIFSTSPGNQGGAQTHSAAWDARNADLPARLAAIGKDLEVSLAGPLAERRHRPVKRIDFNTDKPYWWANDLAKAKSCAIQVVLLKDGTISTDDTRTVHLNEAQLAEVNRLIRQSWQETEALVERHWPAIERTANALLSGRPLDQDELDALIADRPVLADPREGGVMRASTNIGIRNAVGLDPPRDTRSRGKRPRSPAGDPMSLGNMRANGVRSLAVWQCHHEAGLNDRWPDHMPVPAFGPRMHPVSAKQSASFERA